ncbi:MAG: hypothetical protein PHQ34_05115 [Methanothrix sp.]|nr:hypothetical protein [Methanothrix sp.]
MQGISRFALFLGRAFPGSRKPLAGRGALGCAGTSGRQRLQKRSRLEVKGTRGRSIRFGDEYVPSPFPS